MLGNINIPNENEDLKRLIEIISTQYKTIIKDLREMKSGYKENTKKIAELEGLVKGK